MGGGAFEHLYRGRRSSDGKGFYWFVLIVFLFVCVMMAAIGNKRTKTRMENQNTTVETTTGIG